ncbi:triple tyrosine motif-containing protein [Bacteroidota bacterium]
MQISGSKLVKFFAVVILTITVSFSFGQSGIESGRLPIRNFSPIEFNGLPQSFSFAQDKRGIIYVGNTDGLLEYDGINWRKSKLPNEEYIRSLWVSKSGILYVGGFNEMGYMLPDETGLLKYNSLLNLVPEELREFENVWNILETSDGIFFHTKPNIFLYKDDTIRILSSPKEKFNTSFEVNGEFIVYDKNNGLYRFVENNLQHVEGSENLIDVYSILKLNNQELLIATRSEGLKRIPAHISDIRNKIKPFQSEINNFLIENSVYNGIAINDSLFSFGTLSGGLVVINKTGKLKRIINNNSGLVDETIQYQFLDGHNHLWIATNNGFSRVEINTPITSYNDKNGIVGSVRSLAKLKYSTYAATSVGVFYQENYSPQEFLTNRTLSEKYFKNVGIKEVCWEIQSLKIGKEEFLVVNSNDSVYQINTNNTFYKIYSEKTPYSLYQSRKVPERLYIGLVRGLVSCIYKNGKWKVEKYFDKIESTIDKIAEDSEGNLWLSAGRDGLILVNIKYNNTRIESYNIEIFTKEQGLGSSPYKPELVADTVVFGTGSGLLQYNPGTKTIQPQTVLGQNFAVGERYIHRMKEDLKGNIWFATWMQDVDRDEVGFAKRINGGYFYESTALTSISKKGIIHAIYHDNNNISWLGGPEGLYKFNGNIFKNYKKEYHAFIRRIIIEKDSVLFHGSYFDENGIPSLVQSESLKKVLAYKYNSVTFEFAAINTNTEFPLEFSFFLQGNDKEWSEWSDKTYKDYTNLAEGEYAFQVKARDIHSLESTAATFEFSVLPPWYRTFWAYAGYVILLALFVYVVVTLYTKNLREIIKRKTSEIRKQKEEIEDINEHIMDSIKYAKRIQTALLPGDSIRESLSEHFVLFKPRDIVSGDYYWMAHRDNKSFIVAADCTGHGVPGAFMSMLGMSFLNEIVNKSGFIETDQILNKLRDSVIHALKQTGRSDEAKDGMDLALYAWDRENNTIEFSGANNPLYYTRPLTKEELALLEKEDESFLEKGEIHDGKYLLKQLKADKMPIGIYVKADVPFKKEMLTAEKGYTLYTFSDGYVDQFGGETGKKFMTKAFKILLLSLYEKPMEEQRQLLDDAFENWKGDKREQVDDVLVVGLRI